MRTGRIVTRKSLAVVASLVLPALVASAETPRMKVIPERRAQQALSAMFPAGAAAQAGAPTTGRVVSRSRTAGSLGVEAPRISYSVELPQISRVQGLAFYRTSVDISNNTLNGGVVARFQYSYTCLACNPAGGFFRTAERSITLTSLDNFHSDDFVDYLDSLGILEPDAKNGSYGTLLVTFDNLPSATGWEGTVVARNYNRLVESDPSQGTVGYAYPASLFFESANNTVVATIHDTQLVSPTPLQGSQRTNLGVRSTDINGGLPGNIGTNRDVTVQISFIDVTSGSATNGQEVGTRQNLTLRPGEVQQISGVFNAANIPAAVSDAIAFVDVIAGPADATIEGYVNIIDQTTQDGAFFEMKCADSDGICGQ